VSPAISDGLLVFAIDPGYEESGWVTYAAGKRLLDQCGMDANETLLSLIRSFKAFVSKDVQVVIEMVESFGMPVGKEVFHTVLWIGRFIEAWNAAPGPQTRQPVLLTRRQVKLEICHSARATDANIRQAIVDVFGPTAEKAIGVKKAPGPLYALKGHAWQALALAICWVQTQEKTSGRST
jgi:hypothetical protein